MRERDERERGKAQRKRKAWGGGDQSKSKRAGGRAGESGRRRSQGGGKRQALAIGPSSFFFYLCRHLERVESGEIEKRETGRDGEEE